MTNIDKSKPVLVTGATGYVAGWLVKKLLEEGLTVHAAVRNPDNVEKRAHLDELAANTPGSIRYFKADLLDEGAYAEAMAGCELVYHTASPFTINVKDPQKELIEPAVKGTENVLIQANKTSSVKRVVVTSSCAAIYTDAIDTHNTPTGELTEDVWNTTASLDYQPYSYSKTLAEKKAWEIADAQDKWDMVTINPCAVMGPPLNPKTSKSESINILMQLGDGSLKTGAPKMGIGVVDVRDVAESHYRAGFYPHASGRYITCAHNTDLLEVAQTLVPKYGESFPIPTKAAPKWLLMLIGPLINKSITRRFVKNNINVSWKASNSKIRTELDMQFKPLRETMEDSFESLIQEGLLKAN